MLVMDVSNVLIYVCDALRWDELPDSVADRGVAFKTVAQSTWSPPCFTTLSTGLHPEQHGVLKFQHELADGVRTVYDIDGLDGAYYNKHPNDRLADVFGVNQDRGLDELEAPFLFLERDLTTHSPYDEIDSTDPGVYLAEVGDDWDRMREDYRSGVRKSVELFESRAAELDALGARDDTLVVFTSDHGELLGEYGDVGHSNPTSPELAYVPTVFLHPSLSESDFHADPESDIIEQVDVVETVLSMIGFDEIRTDGVDLTSRSRETRFGYNYVRVEKNDVAFYETRSVWDHDGGHVFLTNSRLARLAYYLYRQFRSKQRYSIRGYWGSVLKQYIKGTYRYGDPSFEVAEARRFVDAKLETFETVEPTEVELGEETEQQLRDMGYLEGEL